MGAPELARHCAPALDCADRHEHDQQQAHGDANGTVSRYENGADALGDTLARIQRALEGAGVVFIDQNREGGPGVRLKDPI